MKRKRQRRTKFSKREQAKRNRLRIKLIKDFIKGYHDSVGWHIRSIIRNPDAYVKKQMLNKITEQKQEKVWFHNPKEGFYYIKRNKNGK